MTWRTPDLSECNPGLEPVGFKVLVAPALKAAVTSGGIILPEDTRAVDDHGSVQGRIVALSPMAFTFVDWPAELAHLKPKVGDVVQHRKYAAPFVRGRDGRDYRLMSDQDVEAVVERAAEAVKEAA